MKHRFHLIFILIVGSSCCSLVDYLNAIRGRTVQSNLTELTITPLKGWTDAFSRIIKNLNKWYPKLETLTLKRDYDAQGVIPPEMVVTLLKVLKEREKDYESAFKKRRPTKLQPIKNLNLVNQKLTRLPSSIGNLKSLRTIDVSSNKLKELPETIGKLSKLEIFDLSSNSIRDLPLSMGTLPGLHTLNLSFNKLKKSALEVIAKLTTLRRLTFDGAAMPLQDVESTIGKLKNIQLLHLENLKFTQLPKVIRELPNLQTLILEYNTYSEDGLKTIDDTALETIGELKNLRTLNLFGPKLNQEVLESITHLINLQDLFLEQNNLTELPKTINKLENLRTLAITLNELSEIPKSIGGLENLEKLILSENKLTKLPGAIDELKNLRLLELDGNPLTDKAKKEIRRLLPHTHIKF